MHAVVFTLSLVAFGAAPAAPAQLNAFDESRVRQDLPSAATLSPSARASLEAGAVVSTEPRLGVPRFLWNAASSTLTPPRLLGKSPVAAAQDFLAARADLYRVDPELFHESRVDRLHQTGEGAVIVSLKHDEGGLPVFRDEVKVVMTPSFEVRAVSGYLTPSRRVLAPFSLVDSTAALVAVADVTGVPTEASSLEPTASRVPGETHFRLPGQPRVVRVRPTYFALPEGLEPAFYVEVRVDPVAQGDYRAFALVVSARDGRMLFRNSMVSDAASSFNVWAEDQAPFRPFDGPQGNATSPLASGAPGPFTPTFVPQKFIMLSAGAAVGSDPWLLAGATRTSGNNATTFLDVSRPLGFSGNDIVGTATAPNVFDRPYDVADDGDANPTQSQVAVTQLFFDVNFFHDWYYGSGFDEKAGNAQERNFGRGGKEGDAFYASAQSTAYTNNAFMDTPSDGDSPTLFSFLFVPRTGNTAWLDGADAGLGRTTFVGVAAFGPKNFNLSAPVTSVVESVDGGVSRTGCEVPWTSNVAGRIAVVDRGGCNFVDKVRNAQDAGAVGVVVGNVDNSAIPPLVGTAPDVTIPSLSVGVLYAQSVRNASDAGETSLTLQRTFVPKRDVALDNAVMAHEWGHYASNRLIGDGNGLDTTVGRSLGEGWADFHALLMAVRAEDATAPGGAAFSGTYAIGSYSAGAVHDNPYYYGVRRVPYSIDFTKNALTLKHLERGQPLPLVPTSFGQNGSSNDETHSAGEVWATALWECYASLLRDAPRLTFDQAQSRMKGYLIAGYKATPLSPDYLEARDALLSVMAAADNEDFTRCSDAFARRGFGVGAKVPARGVVGNVGVVQSFANGGYATVVSANLSDTPGSCDADDRLDRAETGTLTVVVRNTGSKPLTALKLSVQSMGPDVELSSMGSAVANAVEVSVPPLQPFTTGQVTLSVRYAGKVPMAVATLTLSLRDDAGGLMGVPTADLTHVVRFTLNADERLGVRNTDDFETKLSSWTASASAGVVPKSTWHRAQIEPLDHRWLAAVGKAAGSTSLTSLPFKVSATEAFRIKLNHRFAFDAFGGGYFINGGVIELSTNDGASWEDIGTSLYRGSIFTQGQNPLRGRRALVYQSQGYPNRVDSTLDLGKAFAGKAVRLRFVVGHESEGAAAGWEISSVALEGVDGSAFPGLVADPNACTNRVPKVTVPAPLNVVEGDTVTLSATATDEDGDDTVLTWTQVKGAPVTLTGATFVAPAVTGREELRFSVVASDGLSTSVPVEWLVTVLDARAELATMGAGSVSGPIASGCGCVSGGEGGLAVGLLWLFAWRRRQR